ncbi:PP2C family serine/threonine-protein phosphatase [Paenibacillus sp. 2TAB23]|uniref:PP2C family protein-serine/threonine phosphatase n=1 Tax=Paenibacillus sp. 2TAB23 TaxID=3233004 RepID=UPI003F971933
MSGIWWSSMVIGIGVLAAAALAIHRHVRRQRSMNVRDTLENMPAGERDIGGEGEQGSTDRDALSEGENDSIDIDAVDKGERGSMDIDTGDDGVHASTDIDTGGDGEHAFKDIHTADDEVHASMDLDTGDKGNHGSMEVESIGEEEDEFTYIADQAIRAEERARIGIAEQGDSSKFNSIQVQLGSAQHIGEREEQQDAYCYSELEDSAVIKKQGVLAVLADGMGGYEMGKEAGELASQTMLNEYRNHVDKFGVPGALAEAVHAANKAVYDLALAHELEWSVGTTLIAVVIQEGRLYWISAGDSRIYLYRSGSLIPLTKDHIYGNRLQELVNTGELTQEEADTHPERHLLTSYLGIPIVTELDANEVPLRVIAGDHVILCSDGLNEDLTEELLKEAVRLPPSQASAYIIAQVCAQNRPYQDNATIVVLRCY